MKNRIETHLTEKGHLARAKLLSQAATKPPQRFYQYDAFYMPKGGDSVLHPNEDGWALSGGQTIELFNAMWNVRVFVRPNTDPAGTIKALKAIIEWIEQNKDHHFADCGNDCWLPGYPEGEHIGTEALQEIMVYEVEESSRGGIFTKALYKKTLSDGICKEEITQLHQPSGEDDVPF